MIDLNAESPARRKIEAIGEAPHFPKLVQFSNNDTGITANLILSFFLMVDFLNDDKRDDYFIVVKGKKGCWVVEQDVGI